MPPPKKNKKRSFTEQVLSIVTLFHQSPFGREIQRKKRKKAAADETPKRSEHSRTAERGRELERERGHGGGVSGDGLLPIKTLSDRLRPPPWVEALTAQPAATESKPPL